MLIYSSTNKFFQLSTVNNNKKKITVLNLLLLSSLEFKV